MSVLIKTPTQVLDLTWESHCNFKSCSLCTVVRSASFCV